jgi:hypothetical protein
MTDTTLSFHEQYSENNPERKDRPYCVICNIHHDVGKTHKKMMTIASKHIPVLKLRGITDFFIGKHCCYGGSIRVKYLLKSNRDCERDLAYVQDYLEGNVNTRSLIMSSRLLIHSFPPELYVDINTFKPAIDLQGIARKLIEDQKTKVEISMERAQTAINEQNQKVKEQIEEQDKELFIEFFKKYIPGYASRSIRQNRIYKDDLREVLEVLKTKYTKQFQNHHISWNNLSVPKLRDVVKTVAASILQVQWTTGFPSLGHGYTFEEPDDDNSSHSFLSQQVECDTGTDQYETQSMNNTPDQSQMPALTLSPSDYPLISIIPAETLQTIQRQIIRDNQQGNIH